MASLRLSLVPLVRADLGQVVVVDGGLLEGGHVADDALGRGHDLEGDGAAAALAKAHVQKLNSLSMRWANKNDERWDGMLLDLTNWIADHTDASTMPADTRTKDGTNLYMWARRQQYKSAKGELLPYQQMKWDAFIKNLYYQRMR